MILYFWAAIIHSYRDLRNRGFPSDKPEGLCPCPLHPGIQCREARIPDSPTGTSVRRPLANCGITLPVEDIRADKCGLKKQRYILFPIRKYKIIPMKGKMIIRMIHNSFIPVLRLLFRQLTMAMMSNIRMMRPMRLPIRTPLVLVGDLFFCYS